MSLQSRRVSQKAYLARHPGLRERQQREIRFGVGANKHFDEQLTSQSGACAICGGVFTPSGGYRTKATTAHLDHDHVTGQLRGLLCGACNFGLGHFKDQPDLLRKATKYLVDWKNEN